MRSICLVLVLGACGVDDVSTATTTQAGYLPSGHIVWPSGQVMYHLSSELLADTHGAKAAFDDAKAELEKLTGLRLVDQPDTSQQTLWITTWADPECSDSGYALGGRTIARNNGGPGWRIEICSRNRQTVIHELGHGIGMAHEQNRPDARTATKCHASCIDTTANCCELQDDGTYKCWDLCVNDPCTYGNLGIDSGVNYAYSPYDLASMMQYGSYSYPISSTCPTITANDTGTCGSKNGSCISPLGDLSPEDVNALRTAYQVPTDSDVSDMQFGNEIATGDFDDDGYVDVAVTATSRTSGTKTVGAVYLFKGVWGMRAISSTSTATNPWLTALVPWKKLTPETFGKTSQDGEQFGWSLKSADFNGDGIDDLAIGAPGRDSKKGAVYVAYGQKYVQPSWQTYSTLVTGPYLTGTAANDRFGDALAAGDFDADGLTDLAIGATGKNAVARYRQASGLLWLQSWISATSAAGDDFGKAITVNDWDGDGSADIAIGAPGAGAGKVYLFLSSKSFANPQSIVMGTQGTADEFGDALVDEDFLGAGSHQLAVGAPSWGGSGRVVLYTWNAATKKLEFAQRISQTLVSGQTDGAGDRFGKHLRARHLHGSTHADLIASASYKADGTKTEAGAFYVLRADTTAFTSGIIHRSPYSETGAHFGAALGTGDFDNDGEYDVVVGAPHQATIGTSTHAGVITAYQGSSSGLTGSKFYTWAGRMSILP